MGKRAAWASMMVLCTACAAHLGPSSRTQATAPEAGKKYVDTSLGFEMTRPEGEWQMELLNEKTPEGVVIPVVLRHRASGAEVVIQVAPAIATPSQFAERLTQGLNAKEGFSTTDPEPLPLSDDAVGFRFAVSGKVFGRVAVREGTNGRMLMLLGTWPANAPQTVSRTVDAIFDSVQPLRLGHSG